MNEIIKKQTTNLEKIGATEKGLMELKQRWATTPCGDKTDGLALVTQGIREARELRIDVGKRCKHLIGESKKVHQDFAEKIGEAKSKVIEVTGPIEERLNAEKDRVTEAKKVAKEEKARLESKRQTLLQSKMLIITELGQVNYGSSVEIMKQDLATLQSIEIDTENYQEFKTQAMTMKLNALTNLKKCITVGEESEKVAREAEEKRLEDERIQAEEKAKQDEKVRIEKEELAAAKRKFKEEQEAARIKKAADDKIEAEEKAENDRVEKSKQDEIQAEQDAKQEKLDAAQRKLDADKAEQQRVQDEADESRVKTGNVLECRKWLDRIATNESDVCKIIGVDNLDNATNGDLDELYKMAESGTLDEKIKSFACSDDPVKDESERTNATLQRTRYEEIQASFSQHMLYQNDDEYELVKRITQSLMSGEVPYMKYEG